MDNSGTTATTTLTVTFDKPVYLSATFAASDWSVSGLITGPTTATPAASPTVIGSASNAVTLTVAETTFIAGTLTVELISTGAAKFLDVDGTAATAATITVTSE